MESLKKILSLLVAVTLMLSLVGCTSTNPSLKDVWLNAVNQKSAEAKTTISANVNMDGLDLDEEGKKFLEILESGFIVEQKAKDENNAYLKITAVNDQPLRDLGVWTAEQKASAELIIKDDVVFIRTSADPHFFKIDLNEIDSELGANVQTQTELQKQVMEFLKGEFTDYVSQFNYEIPKLQDLGMKTIETPEGKEEVLKVKMEFGINEMLDFAVYTLDNLTNYEKLDKIVKEFVSVMPAEEQPTEAEISDSVIKAKAEMRVFKGMLSEMTEESLEEMVGKDIDFKVETEMGISKEKYVASEDAVITVGISDPKTGEKGSAVIKVNSLVWNVNGDVQLPDASNAVNIMDYDDINKVKSLPISSPIRKLLMEEYNASFTIGESFAMLGSEFEELDAAPYIKDGSTMVPVATVGKWLGSEAKWDGATGQVTLDVNDTKIQLKLGSKDAYVNGELVKMATAAESLNGRTFVPVKFIATQLGAKSSYDSETSEVNIYFE